MQESRGYDGGNEKRRDDGLFLTAAKESKKLDSGSIHKGNDFLERHRESNILD